MRYLEKKFSTPANSRAYVDNWAAIFGEDEPKPEAKPEQTEPVVAFDSAASE